MAYYYRGNRPLVRSRVSDSWGPPRGGENRRASTGSRAEGVRHEFDPNNVLEIKYPQEYSGNAPIMENPKVMGSYSIDGEREFGHDRSMLHFLDRKYYPENGKMAVNIDLNKGWNKFKKYSGNPEDSFQNFLRWIINNQDRLVVGSQDRLTADFISVRRSFTKIMRTPYNYQVPWTLYAKEFKGSIYIKNWKREEEKEANEGPVMDLVSQWGHTFQHYVKGGNPEEGMDANEEYRCVLKTKVGETTLLYAPEIDCVDPEQYDEDFEDLDAFLQVKCYKQITSEQKMKNHKKFKLNQWWVENKLSGVPRILVGCRNDDGVVHSVELLKTDELPEIAGGEWNPNVCFNFLAKFLEFVKDRVTTDPGTAFVFEREARGHIYCTKMSDSDHTDFLPSWYIKELFEKEKSD